MLCFDLVFSFVKRGDRVKMESPESFDRKRRRRKRRNCKSLSRKKCGKIKERMPILCGVLLYAESKSLRVLEMLWLLFQVVLCKYYTGTCVQYIQERMVGGTGLSKYSLPDN